ncbi:MAG: SDR family oxidoreductase [Bifidobacteriaceae bacterium]|jgi:citronellol/citronellal dehydrogenase|nr:SDR family oxidoreductase [Bifidobacteriaceae bacterium]
MSTKQTSPASRTLRPDALAGQVALVTGAGTGIGRAIALDLAKCGADLVLAGRRAEPLEATAQAARQAGRDAQVVPCDIRHDRAPESLVSQAMERFGRIDALVNNAGGQFMAPAEEITPKGWRAVNRLAVDAAWALTRQVALDAMIPARQGLIVFIGFSPRRGIPGMVHATAARAAVGNLAQGLALEWSRYGIRSVCVNAGTIDTDGLSEAYSPEDRARWASGVPLGRLGRPEDVSGLVAFLASPAAAYITGTQLLVDGGADAWGAAVAAPSAVPVPSVSSDIEVLT